MSRFINFRITHKMKFLLFALFLCLIVTFDKSVYSVSSSACSAFSSPPIPDDGSLPVNYFAWSIVTFTSAKYGTQTTVTEDAFVPATELGGNQVWESACNTSGSNSTGSQSVEGAPTLFEYISSHTLTNETEISFGLSVGNEGTGDVGVTHKETESNGWQLTVVTGDPIVTSTQNYDIEPGKCGKISWERKKRWIDFTRDKFTHYSNIDRYVCTGGTCSWIPQNGQCQNDVLARSRIATHEYVNYRAIGGNTQYATCTGNPLQCPL